MALGEKLQCKSIIKTSFYFEGLDGKSIMEAPVLEVGLYFAPSLKKWAN